MDGLADLLEYNRLEKLLQNVGYKAHPGQQALQRDPHRFKVVRCGRRFGKTVFAVNELIRCALITKPGDYWYVAPTYKQAKLIAWRLLLRYLPESEILKKNETELAIELRNGSLISLKGADNPDSLRGTGIDGLVMDEYAFTDPYAFEAVLRPQLTDRKGWVIFISTPNGYNHFYHLYNLENENANYKSFHFTSYDNPHLDSSEIDDARGSMSDERFSQEYLAEFTKRAGTIWPFNREVHVVGRREPDKSDLICGSIDFGFATGHPTAVLWHALNAERVYTFDGFVEESLTIEQIDEFMRSQTQGLTVRAIYCDSARPDLIEELRRRSWPILEAKKDVELGIAKVGEYMQINPLTNQPRWTISQHLTEPIRQIENYVWQETRAYDEHGNVVFKQVPLKQDDDACDALRYFVYSHSHPVANQPKKKHPIYSKTGRVIGYK